MSSVPFPTKQHDDSDPSSWFHIQQQSINPCLTETPLRHTRRWICLLPTRNHVKLSLCATRRHIASYTFTSLRHATPKIWSTHPTHNGLFLTTHSALPNVSPATTNHTNDPAVSTLRYNCTTWSLKRPSIYSHLIPSPFKLLPPRCDAPKLSSPAVTK